MNVFSASRRAPAAALTPLAIVSALSLCFAAAPAQAQAQSQTQAQASTLPPVTVTGSRFASDPALAPIGATVINAADIRLAGVSDVNQAIRKIGGVYGRQSLDGSPDFGLDLRGFGTNSNQNLVVMLDGVRLSENELSGSVLSSIPIETVERIEIIRGGASVLFGEGASGGVIQIVTRRPGADGGYGASSGVLRAEAGRFGQRDLRASLAQDWDGFAADAAVGHQKTDNYRDHNQFRQNTFSGALQWRWQGGRAGLRANVARQDSELPGSLTMAQFQANPRASFTPDDFGALDAERVTAFAEQRVGGLDLAAELSQRSKTVEATYFFVSNGVRSGSLSVYDSKQTQFSPRLRHLSDVNGMVNELVAGIDLMKWTRDTESSFSNADASQKSRALYVRDEIKFGGERNARLAAGARRERFDKQYVDVRGFIAPESTEQHHTAWEVQGSVDPARHVTLYAKAGRSYRVANADENSYRSSDGALKVQTSRDLELGATLSDAGAGVTARVFRHDLRDEIFFDPTTNFGFGANTNLDPTERNGVEIDAHADLARGWRLSGHAQHVRARFTEGPNAGRDMVLVPKNVVSARLAWAPGSGHSADAGVQWVGKQRYGSDFANSCGARMPSYATLDARYARQLGPWEFSVAGLNLADKQYFSNAFGCRSGIYPSDGRQLKLAARYDF